MNAEQLKQIEAIIYRYNDKASELDFDEEFKSMLTPEDFVYELEQEILSYTRQEELNTPLFVLLKKKLALYLDYDLANLRKKIKAKKVQEENEGVKSLSLGDMNITFEDSEDINTKIDEFGIFSVLNEKDYVILNKNRKLFR